MPAVPITSREQYTKAIGVLTRVGGTWHGVGDTERYLLVNDTQYNALIEAKVIDPQANGKHRAKKPPKASKS